MTILLAIGFLCAVGYHLGFSFYWAVALFLALCWDIEWLSQHWDG